MELTKPRLLVLLFVGSLSAALWMACGGSETVSTTSTDGGGSAGAAGGASGGGGSAGTGGSSTSSGTCGGQKCGPLQRCAHRTCGAPDSEGQCRDLPLDCLFPPNTWEPVCGCDGRVRAYNCNDIDLGPAENCKTFRCSGTMECMIATEYCERQVSDVGGVPDGYACKPLPASCAGNPSCACVRSEACGARCAGSGALGMKLTCPGG